MRSAMTTTTPAPTTARPPALIEWLTPAITQRQQQIWQAWTGVVLAGYLIIRALPLTSFVGTWQPVGVLTVLSGPLPNFLLWILWALSLAGALQLAARVRSSLPTTSLLARTMWWAGPVALVILLSHRSSGGQILWFDILPVLHVVAIAAAGIRFDAIRSGWAMRLAALMTTITYVLAGVAKLRLGGTAWIAEGALERHIVWAATRLDVLGGTPSPVAAPLVDLGLASVPLALAVVVIELSAPVALFSRRFAWGWSIAAWSMHLFIAITLFVLFHWPLFGVAFAPLVLLHRRGESERAQVSPGVDIGHT